MVFAHVSLIQEGQAALFYRHTKKMKGYMIAGTLIGPDLIDKMNFAKIWKYFVSEVVQADDIYCSISLELSNSMFNNYLDYHSTIDGIKIYKVDNFLKKQYSSYDKHKESVAKP